MMVLRYEYEEARLIAGVCAVFVSLMFKYRRGLTVSSWRR